MTTQTAAELQRLEDHLTGCACRLEAALAILGRLPTGREQRLALIRLLRAARLVEAAGDALEDPLAEACSVLVPEAIDSGLDF